MTVGGSRLRRSGLALVSAGARLNEAGLILPGEGNLSMLTGGAEHWVLITPRGADKARLAPEDMVAVPWPGDSSDGWRRVWLPSRASTETRMHLAIYEECPGVAAVVHAHPPRLLQLAIRGLLPDCGLLEEGERSLGAVSWVPAAVPGSLRLAKDVAAALLGAPACVLKRHGAVTTGSSLEEAFRRMLLLERLAELTLGAS